MLKKIAQRKMRYSKITLIPTKEIAEQEAKL
jgi:hypothetical protein